MAENLSEIETRGLGSLIEKQLTTPEYYPLTLNALAAACNQKSNRNPVVNFDETSILGAIDNLRDKNLVYLYYGSTSRAVKYKHMLPSVFEVDSAETALLCVLMLRGSQTTGELRERTGRLHEFTSLAEVTETLNRLADREQPLVVKLKRQAGQKEARFTHLLSGEKEIEGPTTSTSDVSPVEQVADASIARLENEIQSLRNELLSFRETFDEFRKQFD